MVFFLLVCIRQLDVGRKEPIWQGFGVARVARV